MEHFFFEGNKADHTDPNCPGIRHAVHEPKPLPQQSQDFKPCKRCRPLTTPIK
jgi:hypothetical protein